MKRVDKPWGYELWWAVTDRYVGKIIHVDAGHSLSLQYHQVKHESMYLLQGSAELWLNGARRLFEPGTAAVIPPFTEHRLVALTDVDVVEVSTPELDDVVRLDDRYGRQGTSQP
ncbi:MAG: cupin domain-containing protein [Thermaerobacter sp.]|nr:cupin domain-containing protein [Thermaerobacter sp.]